MFQLQIPGSQVADFRNNPGTHMYIYVYLYIYITEKLYHSMIFKFYTHLYTILSSCFSIICSAYDMLLVFENTHVCIQAVCFYQKFPSPNWGHLSGSRTHCKAMGFLVSAKRFFLTGKCCQCCDTGNCDLWWLCEQWKKTVVSSLRYIGDQQLPSSVGIIS